MSGKLIRKCAPGTELVNWLVNLSPIVHTQPQATGMWQALLEEGVISHGKWKGVEFIELHLTLRTLHGELPKPNYIVPKYTSGMYFRYKPIGNIFYHSRKMC